MRTILSAAFAATVLSGGLAAPDHDNMWVKFVESPGSLSAGVISSNSFDNTDVGSGAPYHTETGDLNADGRPEQRRSR